MGVQRGAILADECDLGKTIEIFLALHGMVRRIYTMEQE